MTSARVALITGGAKRVGRAIVERFAAAGFDIAFTYLHSEAPSIEVEQQVLAQKRRCLRMSADLTDPGAAVDRIFSEFARTFGRLDVLVNNASLYEPSELSSVTTDDVRRMMAIHVESPLLLCRAFAGLLRTAQGHVVNMVDYQVERPWHKYVAYCASKAALSNLTLSLAREFAPDVTVNGIAPGVVAWPADYPPEDRERYLKRVPLARPGTPQDAAELALFLCTGGSYMTGQILRLDGGRSIT